MAGYANEVKAKLKEAGCSFDRQGKVDHEIWYSPMTGKNFRSTAG